MSAFERKSSVSKFVKKWSNRGYEKGEAQSFWLSLLRDVFNIAEPENFISFEVPIPHGFIDALISNTKVLIEQKSSTVNLDDPEIFRQAKRYNDALEYSRKARWIITCNFREFRVFDMDKRYPEREPLKISLFELPKKFSALNFLVELQDKISYERELSVKASKIVAKIYDGLRENLKLQSTSTNFACDWYSAFMPRALTFSASTKFSATTCAPQEIFVKIYWSCSKFSIRRLKIAALTSTRRLKNFLGSTAGFSRTKLTFQTSRTKLNRFYSTRQAVILIGRKFPRRFSAQFLNQR